MIVTLFYVENVLDDSGLPIGMVQDFLVPVSETPYTIVSMLGVKSPISDTVVNVATQNLADNYKAIELARKWMATHHI